MTSHHVFHAVSKKLVKNNNENLIKRKFKYVVYFTPETGFFEYFHWYFTVHTHGNIKKKGLSCEINSLFIINLFDVLYLLHCKPWNTGFYPLKKSDIFTSCYFHTVKISKWCFHSVKITNYCDVTLCIMYCMQCLRSTCKKKKRKFNK